MVRPAAQRFATNIAGTSAHVVDKELERGREAAPQG
jgi:hypothetical protein